MFKRVMVHNGKKDVPGKHRQKRHLTLAKAWKAVRNNRLSGRIAQTTTGPETVSNQTASNA